jgi:hypothetical protein
MCAPLRVWTAQYSYRGADRLDVTRKSTDPVGIVFAPSESILRPVLELRHVSESLCKAAAIARKNGADERVSEGEKAARIIEDAAWALYVPLYRAEMLASHKRRGATWRMVLGRDEVTFCCFCNLKTHPGHCHRLLLAGFFEKLGAQYMGER